MMEEITQATQDITEAAWALLQQTRKELTEGIKSAAIPDLHDQYFQWIAKDFTYTPKGVRCSEMSGQTITKPSPINAYKYFWPKLKGWDTYNHLLGLLQQHCPHRTKPDQDIDGLVQLYLKACYSCKTDALLYEQTKDLLWRMIRDLCAGPMKFALRMELQGITLESTTINLPDQSVLRQTTQVDIETPREIRVADAYGESMHHPMAILEGSFELVPEFNQGKHSNIDLQAIIKRYVVILRLFAVGSVKTMRYSLQSDIVIESNRRGGVISNGHIKFPQITYYLRQVEEAALIRFMEQMSALLPADFCYHDRKTSFLTIAYDRYSDALLEHDIIEKQVASTMMGLEAIFSNENMEVGYKLRQRVAKMAAICGKDPLTVVSILKEAYGIRSTFAHGGLLDQKHKEKISQHYGSPIDFLKEALEILRLSIVVCISCQLDKNKFIRLLDEAMVDEGKAVELKEMLQGYAVVSLVENSQRSSEVV